MSIKELEEARDDFIKVNAGHTEEDMLNIGLFMNKVINTFEEYRGELEKVKRQADENCYVLQCYRDYIKELKGKVEKLEHTQTYYPMTETGIPGITDEIGGTY